MSIQGSIWKNILRVVGPYVVFAGLWILLSDWLLEKLMPDPAQRTSWSIYKGWAFVLITALLLSFLLRARLVVALGLQREAERMARLYAALSEVNQLITRVTSREELLPKICEMLVQHGRLKMVWIGFVDPPTKQVVPAAQCGDSGGYLAQVKIFADDRPEGRGPVGLAIRREGHCVINDFATAPEMAPWRETGARNSFRSIAAFAIRQQGQVCGALTVYAAEAGFFQDKEIKLLLEAALDISFALDNLEKEARRRRNEEVLRLAEANLRHSHHLMQYIIEHARSAIAVHDRELRYIFVSQRYLQEYKVKEQNIIGKHHYEVFPDLPQKWRDVHQRALRGEVCSADEDSYPREDGSLEWTRWECRPWYEADGAIGGIIIYTEVITERRNLEQHLRQRQRLESVGQLAGGVAHDFNNILASMMINLDFACEDPGVSLETRATLRELMNEARRAANLTRQLLMFSRRSVLQIKSVDLNDLAANLLKMLGRLIGEHIIIRLEPSPGLPPVEADAGMLEQVLLNLCVNARDAMPQGGQLTIAFSTVHLSDPRGALQPEARPGSYVCISVTDTGCGMDEATQQRIFEPFFTTKEAGKGTGLGLATVHGIVGQHKGWVQVESKPGQGSKFTVFLPAASRTGQPPIHTEKLAVQRGHEIILLVEDEASVRRAIAQRLRQLDYVVFEAENGPEALKIWEQHREKIDLVLSDMVMPGGMNGLELLTRLHESKPSLRLILSSGYSAEMAEHPASLGPQLTFLQKPYEIEVLSQMIRKSMERN